MILTHLDASRLLAHYRQHHWHDTVDLPALTTVIEGHDDTLVTAALDHWALTHDTPPTALELEIALTPRDVVASIITGARRALHPIDSRGSNT
jgi:hypothetical protein